MESVQLLYESCAEYLNEKPNTLAVVACDAGSDKSFDFLGLATVMECVKDIVLSIWNNVIFHRERKLSTHLDLIAKSLPILEKITAMKEAKQIEPERAEKWKRDIIDVATKFIQAGVTIPEIEQYTIYSPRQLMAPERKLLVASKEYEHQEEKKGDTLSDSEASGEGAKDTKLQAYIERIARQVLKEEGEGKGGSMNSSPNQAQQEN